MNRSLYKWHVYSALFVSIFFGFLLLSGITNVFHGKIKQWENPQFFREVESEGELLSPEELYNEFSVNQSDYSISLFRKLPGKDKLPIECMMIKDQKEVYGYINPISAELIGVNENPIHKKILKWHTSLMLGTIGHIIMGLVGIVILISLMSGIVYFIQQIKWNRVKNRSKKWHFGLGILTLIFNLMMVFTGIFLQYQDITKEKKTNSYDYPGVSLNLDSVLVIAQNTYPDVSLKRIKFPASGTDPLVLIGNQPGNWYLGAMPFELKLDPSTAEILSVKEENSIEGISWLQKTIFTLHAGQYGGYVSRWIYLLFSLGTMGSIFTGLYNYRQLKKISNRKKSGT